MEDAFHHHHDIAWFAMETVHRRQKRSLDTRAADQQHNVAFNDPRFPDQWHLVNEIVKNYLLTL
jgi:hypothetical protein